MLQSELKLKGCSRQAFLIALLAGILIFVPAIIFDKGYFFFYGDFNVQQIPFYKLAHEAVRSGGIFWDWHTDLGANFIGSYSFYLLGSPFFWLTIPFPTEFIPHLMGPLLILKHACAALTATFYLKRFVQYKESAIMGGLLYAFSGFIVYNIFFNHFHEPIIFFPLLLAALEELIVNDRRGFFAAAVAINAIVNYWFFIGEVVFVLIYFAIRSYWGNWRMTFKKFLFTAGESILGVMIAMFLLLPSALALMGNPRTGTDELLNGWNFWLYWHNQMYPAIVSSTFFPPDLPSRPNLFPDRGAKWASLSAWLPLFSMSGVIAYIRAKKDWLKKALLICFLIALVPGLNSMFILFNHSYYARWYYMPVLLMCLASVRAVEDVEIDLEKGIQITAAYTLAVTAIIALTPKKVDGKLEFGLSAYPERFAAVAAIALLSLAAFYFIVRRHRGEKSYWKAAGIALCVVIVVHSLSFIAFGKAHSDDMDFLREVALEGRYDLEIPDEGDGFVRHDLYKSMDNLGLYWHIPNIQAFHSIIPVSIMDFYPTVGVKRDVSSKPETKYYQLRSLLSVKWLFVKETEEDQDVMPGYTYVSNQMGYNLYRNDNFVPMGFTYDFYITESELRQANESQRAALLMRAIALPIEHAAYNSDLLGHLPAEDYPHISETEFAADAQNRRETAATSFETDNRGFTATINLPRENLVFFSVPYESGWSATVNGEPAEVIRASIGFMAVRAPEGENVIRFRYRTPGLSAGITISIFGVILLVLYLVRWRKETKNLVLDCEENLDNWYPLPWNEWRELIHRQAEPSLGELLEEPGQGYEPEKEEELPQPEAGESPLPDDENE